MANIYSTAITDSGGAGKKLSAQEAAKTNAAQVSNLYNAAQEATKTNAAQVSNLYNAAQEANKTNAAQNAGLYGAATGGTAGGTGSELAGGIDRQMQQNAHEATAAGPALKPAGTGGTPLQTTYIDANGDKQAGLVQEDTGTSAGTADNTTAGTAGGSGSEAELSYWEKMKQYYTDLYDQQVAANNDAAAASYAQAVDSINRSIDSLTDQYRGTNKQLYRDYMDTLRTTPQKLAAMGYSGGITESSRLGVDTAYQEALAENERARLGNVASLNAQQAQAKYEADAAAAKANQTALTNKGSYLAALQEQQHSQELQNAQTKAELLAAAGDFSGYRDLGYSQDETDYLTRLWLAENPTLKETWIAGHPADAARLGVSIPAAITPTAGTYTGSGGGTSTTSVTGTHPLLTEIVAAAKSGTDAQSLYAAVTQAYKEGNISSQQANLMAAAIGRTTGTSMKTTPVTPAEKQTGLSSDSYYSFLKGAPNIY